MAEPEDINVRACIYCDGVMEEVVATFEKGDGDEAIQIDGPVFKCRACGESVMTLDQLATLRRKG